MGDKKPLTDSSIARMAGNIAAGLVTCSMETVPEEVWIFRVARTSVRIARMIVKELETE